MVVEKIYVLEVSIIAFCIIYQLFTEFMTLKSLDEINREWDKVPTLTRRMNRQTLRPHWGFTSHLLLFKTEVLCNYSGWHCVGMYSPPWQNCKCTEIVRKVHGWNTVLTRAKRRLQFKIIHCIVVVRFFVFYLWLGYRRVKNKRLYYDNINFIHMNSSYFGWQCF